MSATLLLLGRKLLVGAYSGASVAPPNIAHLGITSGFSSVDVDPVNTVSAQFTLYRVGGVSQAYTLTYTVVPSAISGVTAAYLSDATVLSGVTVAFAPGQSSTTISVVFAAHAKPSADLSGSVVLSGASAGSQIDAAASSFSFAIPAASAVAGGAYDLGPDYTANWTLQTGEVSGTTVTQEADGIVVDNGTSQADQNVSALVWAKTALPLGAWKASFSYTQLDSDLASQSNGVFATLIPGYTGGQNASDPNPNLWTTAQYRDASFTTVGKASKAVVDKYGTGIRATFNQDAVVLSNSDELRSHKVNSDGTETALGGTAYGASWVFDSGTEYLVEISYYPSTSRMNWVRTDPLGASTQVSVIDPNVALAVGQYLGFGVSAARSARFRAFSVAAIADDGGGSAVAPPTTWEDDPANWATPTALAAGTVVSFSSAATLNGTAAGHRYVMSANINAPTTTVTIDGAGTIGSPIVIDGGVTNPASYRLLRLKQIVVQNASHVYFQNLDLSDTEIRVLGTSNHISLERFLAYGHTGGVDSPQLMVGRDNSPAGGDNTDPVRYVRTRYFQYGKAGVTTESSLWRYHGAPHANYLFPNHARYMYCYKGLFTNVSEALGVFNCPIGMWGDNTRDNSRDIRLSVYDNRIENCFTAGRDSVDIIEIKCVGATVARNTYERGVGNNAGYFKNRHGQNDYMGNLFVTRPGAAGGGGMAGITLRDTGARAYNNHAYTLADGVQPTLASPAGHPGDQVHLFRGFLDAELFPGNAGDPPRNYGDGVVGQMEPSAARCKVGGNNMPVVIGDDTAATSTIPPCFNIVPGADAARRDRNRSVSVLLDVNFAGRTKYRLASTGSPVYVGPPAYGTHTATHTTDSGTSLVADGADINIVPHRWLVSEVGPGAAP